MKISVVIPVYNVEKYLHKCVDSVLSQTYGDFELLLLDDGSQDSSGRICDEYAQQDKRVRVFHLQNGGPSRARNIGIDNATGDFLAFIDSDDHIAQEMLERMLLLMEHADIAICNFYSCTDDIDTFCDHKMGNMHFGQEGVREHFIQSFYYSGMTGLGACWNKLYNIKFITANHIRFNEKLIRAEDFWFNFDCFSKASAVATTDEAYYYYEQVNSNSTMHQVRENQYEDWVYNRKELLKRNENIGFRLDYEKFYRGFLYNVSVYVRSIVRNNPKDDRISQILSDEFYLDCLQYDRLLPIHIRFLDFLAKKNRKVAKLFYRIWSRNGK
ncbi:glycosyltransferase family 2 protein [[Ruminococcus] lactaris]|uniref:glycosyltransferase family 2 protein n=1 Tax=[Ruminococcus] lactaris TaxID=46228 RepID=UPI0035221A52